MFKTILVPLDGSKLSESALPMAAALADTTGGQLVLTRIATPQDLPGPILNDGRVHAMQEAEAYLATMAEPLRASGVAVDTAAGFGDAAEGILEEAELRQADLVVMCTHGRTGLGRWVYGSVAEDILARSPIPVLLTRANNDIPPAVFDHPKPVFLVPLDGSRFAETALPYASALARGLHGSILLVHVHQPPTVTEMDITTRPQWVEEVLTRDQAAEEAYLNAIAQRLRDEGLQVQTVTRSGAVSQALLEESWSDGASLIVMATHGWTGIGEVLHGSVALEVLHQSKLPLLLILPSGLRVDDSPLAEPQVAI